MAPLLVPERKDAGEMPDDPKPPEGETPPDPKPDPSADPPADPPAGDEHDPVRAKALIDKLREAERQGKKDAKALADAQARLDVIEAEKLTESERIQKERDDAVAANATLTATNRDNAIKLAVFGAQHDKGIADAELALAALDRIKIEFDEAGQPTNVDALLDDLLERKPILKATPAKPRVPGTDGGGGGGNPPELTAEQLEAAQATGMDPEAYARWDKQAKANGGSIRVADAIAATTPKG